MEFGPPAIRHGLSSSFGFTDFTDVLSKPNSARSVWTGPQWNVCSVLKNSRCQYDVKRVARQVFGLFEKVRTTRTSIIMRTCANITCLYILYGKRDLGIGDREKCWTAAYEIITRLRPAPSFPVEFHRPKTKSSVYIIEYETLAKEPRKKSNRFRASDEKNNNNDTIQIGKRCTFYSICYTKVRRVCYNVHNTFSPPPLGL